MDHSNVIGSSSAGRVIACPGSVKLSAKMPEQPASDYANQGSMLHSVMEQLLTKANTTIRDLLGYTEFGHEFTEDLAREMIDPALKAFDELQDQFDQFSYLTEQRVGSIVPGGFGTADVIGWTDDTVIVVDWKFGRGVKVHCKENPQGLFLASGVRHMERSVDIFPPAVTRVIIAIVQPAFDDFEIWETDTARLDRFDMELQAAMKADHLNDGDHCRWCPAKTICPLLSGELLALGTGSLDEFERANIGMVLDKIAKIQPWINAIKKDAHTMVENGLQIPGWKLAPKRAGRRWIDEEETIKALSRYVATGTLYDRKLKSPAKMEKLLKGSTAPLDGLIESVSSGTNLVPGEPEPDLGQAISALERKLRHG